jgi:hypothetical protein
VIDDSPSFFRQRVRLYSALHEVNSLCSADQRTVDRISYQFRLQFTESLVRVDRGLDKSAQVSREILGILPYTLNGAINGSAALEVRLDGVGLILDEETRQYPNTL